MLQDSSAIFNVCLLYSRRLSVLRQSGPIHIPLGGLLHCQCGSLAKNANRSCGFVTRK